MLTMPASDIEQYAIKMEADSARSLELLKKIQSTVSALSTLITETKSFVDLTKQMTASVMEITSPFPEDGILPLLESLQDVLSQQFNNLKLRRASAGASSELRPDDGVCEAFDASLNSITELYDSVECFRWVIMEHNADLSPHDHQELSSPEDISKYLASL